MKLVQPSEKARGRGFLKSDLQGLAKTGRGDEAQLLKGEVWLPSDKDKHPLSLPLQMGTRHGREYFWNFDRGLKNSDAWVLNNGRLLRVMPSGRPDLAKFYVTITLGRQAPPIADIKPKAFIGIDRGEAVPAAYAVIDTKGRLLKSGLVQDEYREQQRRFSDKKRELQRQSGGYTKWLRSKERNRAKALGGDVSRELLDLAAKHEAPLVMEYLSSGLVTRGGKNTMMSSMQYERVLGTLEQRLAEVGLYELVSDPKFRKGDNGFIKLVGPAYTSSTCSECGQVFSTDFYEALTDTVVNSKDETWEVTLPTGKQLNLPEEYTYWVRGQGEKTRETHDRLTELIKGKPIAKISKTNRRSLTGLLRGCLVPYRPRQAEFHCPCCGYEANADEQALSLASLPRGTW